MRLCLCLALCGLHVSHGQESSGPAAAAAAAPPAPPPAPSCPVDLKEYQEQKRASEACSAALSKASASVTEWTAKYDSLVKDKLTPYERKITTLEQDLASSKKSYESMKQEWAQRSTTEQQALREKLEQTEKQTAELNRNIQSKEAQLSEVKGTLQKTEDELKQFNEKLRQAHQRHEAAVEKLNLLETKIYSSTHFWTSARHTGHVVTAVGEAMRKRVERVLGADPVEFTQLQFTIWKARYQRSSVHQLVLSVYAKASPHIDRAKAVMNKGAEWGYIQMQKGLVYVDKFMIRMIDRLSSADPSVRDIFPESFEDRCYAFAFIMMLSLAVESLISTLVLAPLAAVLRMLRLLPSKQAKKPRTRRSSRQVPAGKPPTKSAVAKK